MAIIELSSCREECNRIIQQTLLIVWSGPHTGDNWGTNGCDGYLNAHPALGSRNDRREENNMDGGSEVTELATETDGVSGRKDRMWKKSMMNGHGKKRQMSWERTTPGGWQR